MVMEEKTIYELRKGGRDFLEVYSASFDSLKFLGIFKLVFFFFSVDSYFIQYF